MKTRPLGDILLDLEKLIEEMTKKGMQWGDILALIYVHLMVHEPQAREEYLNGDHPEFYYGPKKEK